MCRLSDEDTYIDVGFLLFSRGILDLHSLLQILIPLQLHR